MVRSERAFRSAAPSTFESIVGASFSAVLHFGLVLAPLLLFGARARAVDGVIEINQAAALVGGITPGDDPGFPVTLSERGAYRLTGNLALPLDAVGIDATIEGVDIDLGGFAIVGQGSCGVLTPNTCNLGDGIGIHGVDHVGVHDGTIRSGGLYAIQLGRFARVARVDVEFSLFSGISVGERSSISSSTVTTNQQDGITAGAFSIVQDTILAGNSRYGIGTYQGTLVSGCSVSGSFWGIAFLDVSSGGYRGNSISAFVPTLGLAVNLGGNFCNSTLCP